MPIPTTTKAWIVANPPQNEVKDDTFKLEMSRPIPELEDGQVLIQMKYFSNDPAQRGWMQKDADPARLYVPPIRAGEVMRSIGMGQVVASKSEKLKEGTMVSGFLQWSEYVVKGDKEVNPITPVPGQSETINISTMGGVGLTAWTGMEKVGLFKEGQTLLVSGAAGAVGSIAVQLAKNIFGASRVVGIAGGANKCRWVEHLGADKCLDYKSDTFAEDLKKEAEFDVYFDNVGGNILNAALPKVKRYGRVIACGAIAAYNDASANAFPNWFEVIANRITIQGMIVMDYGPELPAIAKKIAQAIKDGKLSTEGAEQVVEAKMEDVPKTWLGLFEGANQGKLITKLIHLRIAVHVPGWFAKGVYQALTAPRVSAGMRLVIWGLWATGMRELSYGNEEDMKIKIEESKENEVPSKCPPVPKALKDKVLVKEIAVEGMVKPYQFFLIETATPPEPTAPLIVYFPGGAYLNKSEPLHFSLCYDLCHRTGSSVLFIRYPLMPQFTAIDVVPKIVSFINTTHLIPKDNVVLMGDSAGGGLAACVALGLAKEKEKKAKVKELVMFCPWTDVSCGSEGIQKVQETDPMLKLGGMRQCGLVWSSSSSLDAGALSKLQDPICSPQFGDLASLTCRISIVVGTYDVNWKDNESFVKKFREQVEDEKRIEMRVWEGGVHDFVLMDFTREAIEAREWVTERILG